MENVSWLGMLGAGQTVPRGGWLTPTRAVTAPGQYPVMVSGGGYGLRGMGEEQVPPPATTTVDHIMLADNGGCRYNRSCVPLFQEGMVGADGKCGCEFSPNMAMAGVFFLPIMPILYLMQNQCGALGMAAQQGIDGKPPTTICKTLNSLGMILPAIGLSVVGWYWIYKATFGKG